MSDVFRNQGIVGSKSAPTSLSSDDIGNADEIDVRHYVHVIQRNKWGIIGLTFIASIYGLFLAHTAQPLYMAEAKVLITPNQPNASSINPVVSSTNTWLFYETQYEIIRSRSVAMAVVKNLKLDKPKTTGKIAKKKPSHLHELKKWLLDLFRADEESPPPPTREEILESLARMVQGGVTITGVEESQIALVGYTDTNPERAALIANAIADAYKEVSLVSRLEVAKKAISWLSERIGDLREKLTQSEAKLQEFQSREGIVDTASHQRIVSRKLTTMTDKLVKAQTDRLDAETRYRQVKDAQANNKSLESLTPVLMHPLIQRLKEEESRISRRVVELNERYGKKHPKMIAGRLEVKEARARLNEEAFKIVEGIKKEYEVALENERRLINLDKEMKSGIRGMKGKEFELFKLEREVATNRQLYETVLSRFKETDVSGNTSFSNVRVIDPALPPSAPFWPRKKRIVAVWLLGGLFVGVAISLVKEGFTNTFRSIDDVERETGIPVIGSIPELEESKLRSYLAGRKLLNNSVDPFFESIKNIRTGIVLSDVDNPPKMIVVTSAIPSEGKTSFSCELAMSFSQLGSTLLLDADLRKPSLAKVMGLTQNPGFADLIAEDMSLKRAVKNDRKSDSLHFLTSGAKTHNALEILSSKKCEEIMQVFRKTFDYIIIDTPPSLLFSDALVVAKLADLTMLVIKSDQTTIPIVANTLKRFHASNIDIFGAVISHMDERRMLGEYATSSYYGDYFNDTDE